MPVLLRYFLALVVAFVATALLTPVAAWSARRFGIIDHPREDRFHETPTPHLGGLAVAVGLAGVGGFAVGASGQLLTILGSALAVSMVGLLDDWRVMRPIVKLIVEMGAGTALWLAGVSAGLFHVPVLDLALTILWVVAVTNALNLLDNMDGLSSGVAAIAALTFFVIAAQRGDFLVASFAAAVAGASLGFLAHNFPPAKVFLGDGGSLLLGFLLAALALKLDLVGEGGLTRAVIPGLILGVPIFDTALVVLARLREHRPIYLGGTDHTSHRLAARGHSGRRVALALYASQAVCCAVALLVLFGTRSSALPVTMLVAWLAALGLYGFLREQPIHSSQADTISGPV